MIWWLLVIAVLINLAGFLVAFKLRSDKLTDFSYGATFFLLALIAAAVNDFSKAKWLCFTLVTLWSFRLAGFLLVRILSIKKDRRFDGVRENFWRFGAFWLGQGVTAWIVLLPSLFVFENQSHGITVRSVVGTYLALAGLVIETIADLQKFRFNQKPANKGRWIDEGLWRLSRHPNYFGEITFWLGMYVFALNYLTSGQKLASLFSPVYIACLLIFVTGLPKLEKYADQKWGTDPEYREYKAHTSILVPLPRR